MKRYIPNSLRQEVAERANNCCEYCRAPQQYSIFQFQIDHIISLKHGGETSLDNLAFTCGFCNINKGSDLGTFLEDKTNLIRFFNPRIDSWKEHFEIGEGAIYAKTPIGAATAKIFTFNIPERIMERKLLLEAKRFPE